MDNTRGSNILLVEDDILLQELISFVFSEMGLSVKSVDSVEKAFYAISQELYNVLIIDYSLADGFGTEVIPALKAKRPEMKVVGISNFDVSNKFYDAGADLFIKKPFPVVSFAKAIKDLLSQNTNGNPPGSDKTGTNQA